MTRVHARTPRSSAHGRTSSRMPSRARSYARGRSEDAEPLATGLPEPIGASSASSRPPSPRAAAVGSRRFELRSASRAVAPTRAAAAPGRPNRERDTRAGLHRLRPGHASTSTCPTTTAPPCRSGRPATLSPRSRTAHSTRREREWITERNDAAHDGRTASHQRRPHDRLSRRISFPQPPEHHFSSGLEVTTSDLIGDRLRTLERSQLFRRMDVNVFRTTPASWIRRDLDQRQLLRAVIRR